MMLNLKQRIGRLSKNLSADITEVPEALQSSHFPGLDGLRGISILIVIASHFYRDSPYIEYIYGDTGVEIFFVISGFLITSLLFKERVATGTVLLKNFYIRRALRILPVSYLFLIVIIILNNQLCWNVPFNHFLASFFYFRNLTLKDPYEWYTGHFWSLSVEEQFYLCFPFFIVSKTGKFMSFACAVIIIIPILNFFVYNYINSFNSNSILHAVSFGLLALLGKGTVSIFVGALFSILLFKKIIVIDKIKSNFYLSFCLFIVGCISLPAHSCFNIKYLSVILFPFIIGYVIVLNLKGNNLFRLILSTQLLTKIGLISYSLYVWQQLFASNQHWAFFKYADFKIVRISMLFIVAFISYFFFERFFLRYKSKFKGA